MFRKARQLRISLAAKCQLLFGLAVALIIAAALFVPWQRIEQLTAEIDVSAAETLSARAAELHALRPDDTLHRGSPSTQPAVEDETVIRLLLWTNATQADALTRFERSAARRLLETGGFVGRSAEAGRRYRYARVEPTCLRCHSPPVDAVADAEPDAASPDPATPALLPLVSIDMPSRVESGQPLLNRLVLLTAGLIAGTLAVITFYIITTRLILEPVRVLQETARRVSEGNIDIRSDINTGDEFQHLSETFNTMLVSLKDSADRLREANKSLDLRLGQLAETNVALHEANKLKSEFIANVSHELRTPLNSIVGFAQLVADSQPASADPKVARYLQNIVASSNHLLELITELLDLAKIEAGRVDVHAEQLSLRDVFEGLTGLLRPLCAKKSLTIEPAVAPEVPILQTDPRMLQQVLYNLLSNAIKFSPVGGIVLMRAAQSEGGRVRIEVVDQGPGIDPDRHQTIFEKFRQADASVTRQHGGTGLGLAISRELTRLLGGEIGVQSAPGQGATFWIELPVQVDSGSRDVRGRTVIT